MARAEHERREGLNVIESMTADLLVITRRLARTGPSQDVPPEAADADGMIAKARELRAHLAMIEHIEIAEGVVVNHAYVAQPVDRSTG